METPNKGLFFTMLLLENVFLLGFNVSPLMLCRGYLSLKGPMLKLFVQVLSYFNAKRQLHNLWDFSLKSNRGYF